MPRNLMSITTTCYSFIPLSIIISMEPIHSRKNHFFSWTTLIPDSQEFNACLEKCAIRHRIIFRITCWYFLRVIWLPRSKFTPNLILGIAQFRPRGNAGTLIVSTMVLHRFALGIPGK